jgi:CheY-like chemotaxis protein
MAKPRVLIVDDEQEAREVVAEYLSFHGWDVLQAGNGFEAMLAVRRQRPSAVVLDLAMPRLGGLEALRRIHAFDPSVRVVVYSGALDPETERQALAEGASAVLAKPGTIEELLRLLAVDAPNPAPAPAEPADAVSATRAQRRLRILLVDDEPAVTDMLGEFLELGRAEVTAATSAAEALRLLAERPPHAIFLDITMPGLSGLDALPAIKALAPDAKVVMVSAIDDESVAKQALVRGAFDYIVKPIDLVYLTRTVETIAAMTDHEL